jgi:BirA family biotin operon repressor/biotin-[acetyl-CoA-carboxylase] ligase
MADKDIIYPEKVKRLLKTVFIAKEIIILKTVDSTNNYSFIFSKEAFHRDGNDAKDKLNGIVIVSEEQSCGRGRFDRKWFSPKGGLWFSIILNPSIPLNTLKNITIIAAAAIANVLIRKYKINVKIKWPNDIYFRQKKLAGILIESENINGEIILVIGIGINVNNAFYRNPDENLLGAISISDILSCKVDMSIFLAELLNSFEKSYIDFLNTQDLKSILKETEIFIN